MIDFHSQLNAVEFPHFKGVVISSLGCENKKLVFKIKIVLNLN